MTKETMGLLLDLANRMKVGYKIKAMARGDKINHTENRAALHMVSHVTAAREREMEKVVGAGLIVESLRPFPSLPFPSLPLPLH